MAAAQPRRSRALSTALRGRRIGLLTACAGTRGGGVAEAVAAQARILNTLGAEPVVFALAEPGGASETLCDARHLFAPVLGPRQIGYAPGQLGQLLDAGLDLLHLHGIWTHPSRVGAQWAARTGRPYVISPHGMLDPWIVARGRWKKALARAGYERRGWSAATRLHALTQAEAGDIRRESAREDAVVIPNPGPQALTGPANARPPHLLYIGRIHPKKNLAALVDGWRAAVRPAEARLDIAGWGDRDDVARFRQQLERHGDPTIRFHGPVFGEAKRQLFETARFVVLPSHSEGLPITILEAWAAGVPTIMSRACNLPQGFAHGAAVDCGTTTESVANAVGRALAIDPGEWLGMAEAALALARGPFSAETVAGRWGDLYATLIAASA